MISDLHSIRVISDFYLRYNVSLNFTNVVYILIDPFTISNLSGGVFVHDL